jgi:hypothetical protein
MVLFSLSLLLSILAQAGDIPVDQMPYELSMTNGERIFAFVNPSDLNGRKFKIPIVLDAPWLRPSERHREVVRTDIVDSQPELPALRKARLKKGWIRHKGIQIDTPDGPQWVLRSEVEWSDRAQAMAAGNVVVGQPTETAQQFPDSEQTASVSESPSPGFLSKWGIHIAVGGVALLGIGLAAWWGFFRTDWASI